MCTHTLIYIVWTKVKCVCLCNMSWECHALRYQPWCFFYWHFESVKDSCKTWKDARDFFLYKIKNNPIYIFLCNVWWFHFGYFFFFLRMSIALLTFYVCVLCVRKLSRRKGGSSDGSGGGRGGLFVPCSIEPFINYGEPSEGGVCASESRREGEEAGYVDREARAASEASIELASFPVAAALKPATLIRHAQTFRRARDITPTRTGRSKIADFRYITSYGEWKIKLLWSLWTFVQVPQSSRKSPDKIRKKRVSLK